MSLLINTEIQLKNVDMREGNGLFWDLSTEPIYSRFCARGHNVVNDDWFVVSLKGTLVLTLLPNLGVKLSCLWLMCKHLWCKTTCFDKETLNLFVMLTHMIGLRNIEIQPQIANFAFDLFPTRKWNYYSFRKEKIPHVNDTANLGLFEENRFKQKIVASSNSFIQWIE